MRAVKMGDQMRCCYEYCPHEPNWVARTEAIRDGILHFHPDCYKNRVNTKKIIKTWRKYIGDIADLPAFKNNLYRGIHVKGTDSDLILFCVRAWSYFNRRVIPLNLQFIDIDENTQELIQSYKNGEWRFENEWDDDYKDYNF